MFYRIEQYSMEVEEIMCSVAACKFFWQAWILKQSGITMATVFSELSPRSATDFASFPAQSEIYYLGKKVQVIGIVKKYKNSPEIIV